MAQLNVKIPEDRLDGLRRLAARRRTPVAWLIKDYIDYLLAGGQPVSPPISEGPTSAELTLMAERGGSFAWLRDEPGLYSIRDGEPV